MSDPVNHPAHYGALFETKDIECIAVTRQLDFDLGNYFKYIHRLYRKGGPEKAKEDFQKARWYMEDWIKTHEPCISLKYFWSGRFAKWTQRQDDRNLTIRNDCAEKAKIAFDFIKEPSQDSGELYARYHLLSIATDLYISPTYWREMMDLYETLFLSEKGEENA